MEFKLFQLSSFAQENIVLRNRRTSNHQNEKDKSIYKPVSGLLSWLMVTYFLYIYIF